MMTAAAVFGQLEMFDFEARRAREIVASGFITVTECRPGYWQPATIADGNALRLACDCRNGKPVNYDELLDFVGAAGLGLQTIERATPK